MQLLELKAIAKANSIEGNNEPKKHFSAIAYDKNEISLTEQNYMWENNHKKHFSAIANNEEKISM